MVHVPPHFDKLILRTADMTETVIPRIRFMNITQRVMRVVGSSKIEIGSVLVQSLHTTAGLLVNENEPGLLKTDFPKMLAASCPEKTEKEELYAHDRPERLELMDNEPVNAVSHLRAIFGLLPSVTLIIKESVIQLGTWKALLFFDCDPEHREERHVGVLVQGDS